MLKSQKQQVWICGWYLCSPRFVYGLTLKSGRVFADPWDLNLLGGCDKCVEHRIFLIYFDFNLYITIPVLLIPARR